jgi:3-carboxy-cis,cis-muconate cycloisomerase
MPSLLNTRFVSTPKMEAIFGTTAHLQAMLDVEAALARAATKAGLVPPEHAKAIAAACRAKSFDAEAIATAGARAGTPVIPLAKALTERVAAASPAAASFVHLGATSQDIIDTALVLQMREASSLLLAGLDRLRAAAARLAEEHADTVLLGRTLLQPGPPVTFGLKAAGWLSALDRSAERLRRSRRGAEILQFGGAVGTLSALGGERLAVAEALAAELRLSLPPTPWHTLRDAQAALVCDLAILVGVLGKIGGDVTLLMQWEVGEAAEPGGAGRGGSSAMPHKRNPTAAMLVRAAAIRVPGLVATILGALPQEHERAAGAWQAEWATIPEIFEAAGSAVANAVEILEGLRVFPEAMARNLDGVGGLVQAERVVVALAGTLSRSKARDLVEAAVARSLREKRPLRDVLVATPAVAERLDPAALDALLDPRASLGAAPDFIRRALAAHREALSGDP